MKRSVTFMRAPFLLAVILSLCSLNACKKDKGNEVASLPNTYISFKADGILKTYTVAGYNLFMEGAIYACNINASDTNRLTGQSINLIIKSQSPIVKGVYGDDNSGSTIQYHAGNNLLYVLVNTDMQITVDKFENNRIEGGFTATIPTSGDSIKLTEGVFKCEPRN